MWHEWSFSVFLHTQSFLSADVGLGTFTAYNDCAPTALSKGSTGSCYWNSITLGRGSHIYGNSSGVLFDNQQRPTSVKLKLEEYATHHRTINHAEDVSVATTCTPAYAEFAPCLCSDVWQECESKPCESRCDCEAWHGQLSYNDEPGWYMTYIFEGLNSKCTASLTFYAHRGPGNRGEINEEEYASRYTLFTLQGTTKYHAEVDKALVSLDDGETLVVRTGLNTDGHVARWTNITTNGSLSVIASHDRQNRLKNHPKIVPPPHPYKAYAGGLLKLEQNCEMQEIVPISNTFTTPTVTTTIATTTLNPTIDIAASTTHTPATASTSSTITAASTIIHAVIVLEAEEATARILMEPGALTALVNALRSSLDFGFGDEATFTEVELFAPVGRLLAEGRWTVRVAVALRFVGLTRVATVKERLSQISNVTDVIGATFKDKYMQALVQADIFHSEELRNRISVRESFWLGDQDEWKLSTSTTDSILAQDQDHSSNDASSATPLLVAIIAVSVVTCFLLLLVGRCVLGKFRNKSRSSESQNVENDNDIFVIGTPIALDDDEEVIAIGTVIGSDSVCTSQNHDTAGASSGKKPNFEAIQEKGEEIEVDNNVAS